MQTVYKILKRTLYVLVAGVLAIAPVGLAEHHEEEAGEMCVGYGPQTPRDINNHEGINPRIFSLAPNYTDMNLCNIHFHVNAEHKAEDFSIYAGEGDHGYGGGYQCNASESLTATESRDLEDNQCGKVSTGDTVEVHWVYTSCDVTPGEGLGSCLSDHCLNPNLRVEAQVFVLVNDDEAQDFSDFTYDDATAEGYHQAKALPTETGDPVAFMGSTTGPSYTEAACSPLQVTWSVRPQCTKLDIGSLSNWCEGNIFNEDHAHGVRELVTSLELLSKIQ